MPIVGFCPRLGKTQGADDKQDQQYQTRKTFVRTTPPTEKSDKLFTACRGRRPNSSNGLGGGRTAALFHQLKNRIQDGAV
jgi:hypothetical protein